MVDTVYTLVYFLWCIKPYLNSLVDYSIIYLYIISVRKIIWSHGHMVQKLIIRWIEQISTVRLEQN